MRDRLNEVDSNKGVDLKDVVNSKNWAEGVAAAHCTFIERKNSHPFLAKDRFVTKRTLIMEATPIMGSSGVAHVACKLFRVSIAIISVQDRLVMK